ERLNMKRIIRVATLGAVGALILAACGTDSSESGTEAGEVPESIVMDLRNDVDSFDPVLSASDQGAMQLFEAIYDTPIRQNYETGGVDPAMAHEWEVTPTKLVFHFRPDLKC